MCLRIPSMEEDLQDLCRLPEDEECATKHESSELQQQKSPFSTPKGYAKAISKATSALVSYRVMPIELIQPRSLTNHISYMYPYSHVNEFPTVLQPEKLHPFPKLTHPAFLETLGLISIKAPFSAASPNQSTNI